jgi:predicted  nucleic acid-binding Zn-ribbon protein
VDLKAELVKLPPLQTTDLRLAALRQEHSSLKAGAPWAATRRTTAAAKGRVNELEGRIAALEREERLADVERQGGEEERARLERRLYSGEVRNARDLEGLQKNIEGVKLRVSEQETRVLEAMEALETLRGQAAAARADLRRLEAALAEQQAVGRERLSALEAEIPRVQAERQNLAAVVDPTVLAEYERVRSRLTGIGVSVVEGESCSACAVAVSPNLLARLRRAQAIVNCESCGRILVLP